MILQIVPYGNPILRQKAMPITPLFHDLDGLISNMWETMYHSNGVGIAAPQVNRAIRLFVIDTIQVVKDLSEEEKSKLVVEPPIKKIFLNATVLEEIGPKSFQVEGCLSIPGIRELVGRSEGVKIKYQDEMFQQHIETFNGINARVILHEYDHIEGKLFIDKLSPLTKKIINGKLSDVITNKVQTSYKLLKNK